MGIYYGLVKREHGLDIIDAVVDCLGGGVNARLLMAETSMQETKFGEYGDPTPYGAGTGLCQHDELPYNDIIRRSRSKHLDAIKERFRIDMREVQWRELENSPILAFIACRLHYKLVPEAIPESVEGRAGYWKKYYNTSAGKGTVEEYIESAELLNN